MSIDNFQYWKELVGLEASDFPELLCFDEKNIRQARISQTRSSEIETALANDLTSVQVHPGWGASTLYYYMVNILKNKRLNLLVLFDYKQNNFQNGELTEYEFIFQVKWKLANGILDIMLSHSLQERYMYEVFGFEDNGTRFWRAYLREKRRDLSDCEYDSSQFYQKFPFFTKMEIADCLNYFLTNFQIQTIFMFLFPSEKNEDMDEIEDNVLEFAGIIKNIFDGKNIAPAAVREIYFSSTKVFQYMKSAYERPYKVILYKKYSSAEIFSMLVNAYKLQDLSNGAVSDVIGQEFISEAYDETLTLSQIMDRVKDIIISSLEGETENIPYKLTLEREKKERNHKSNEKNNEVNSENDNK